MDANNFGSIVQAAKITAAVYGGRKENEVIKMKLQKVCQDVKRVAPACWKSERKERIVFLFFFFLLS